MVLKLSASFSILALFSAALAAAPVKWRLSRQAITNPKTFKADSSIDASAIYKAAKAATGKKLASYPTSDDKDAVTSVIYGDWEDLDGVSAIHFIADMDVDCDGVEVSRPSHSILHSLIMSFFFSINAKCVSAI